MRALVFAGTTRERLLVARTLRSLAALGIDASEAEPRALANSRVFVHARELADPPGPVWMVRAGAWPRHAAVPEAPPKSATGRSLIAIGAIVEAEDGTSADARSFADALARTGGDLTELARAQRLPPIASACLDAEASARLGDRLATGAPLLVALQGLLTSGEARLVRVPAFDVLADDRLRVVQAITSLQQGGAERVLLDLAHELPPFGVSARIAVFGRPLRAAFPWPKRALDLAARAPKRAARAALLARICAIDGTDLVHAHLLDGDVLEALAAAGMPLVVTAHNTRLGWPPGIAALGPDRVGLWIACSRAVESDLAEAGAAAPRRTVWNGIDPSRFPSPSGSPKPRRRWRRAHDLGDADLVLLAIANPRPQKRLELLPAVLAAVQRRLDGRRARLVIVGETHPRADDGIQALAALEHAIQALGVGADVRLLGALADVAPPLAAADVLVSTSAHEGLSLSHLEALAAGVPVVATDVGGAAEVAAFAPALRLVAADADADEIAVRVLAAVRGTEPSPSLPQPFNRRAMAARHAELYPRVLSRARKNRGAGLWLVTNNFSTGGAQSSARRLLLGLAARGVVVRAAVLEEQPAFPTPGRRALLAAGVPVVALPPSARDGGRGAAHALLAHLDDDPPRALLFWNALPPVKVRVADLLLDVPVFDVSPGEMYFASLARFFERPPDALPYGDERAYGGRLAGVIVKYEGEAARARDVLGAPVHVVPNGVELPEAPGPVLRARARDSSSPLRIGTAARLSPHKRIEDLFAAVRVAGPRLPPFELWIAGGADRGSEAYAADLRASASDLPVVWRGELADPRAFLAELDLFAMISEPAGCPNASLEAMAAGLAVVATDVGGAGEQVVDGVTGRLVARGDASAFGEALVSLAHDEARRADFGRQGRARVAARFGLARMVDDYLGVLGLVDDRGGRP